MRAMISTDADFLRKVREIQEARDKAIEPLATVLVERERLRRLLAETDVPYGNAYADATRAGWRPEELAALGAEQPVGKSKARPRTPISQGGRLPKPARRTESDSAAAS
ncbi:hypothetical protein ACGFX4_28515 [Kitasatospora sp. NPDC048365]|uniref:hypothetical protein n=1 Tax=Kitasatospora sp. NPDC048365 TaxID=3364050 RepID=UPI003711E7B8